MAAGVAEAVERGDLDELTRLVDRLADTGDWAGLVDLRDRCRAALQRGRQLWPAAANAEYRIALEAPGQWAGAMLVPGSGRFALGPLTEVAAARHTWEELASHAPPGPEAAFAAHERVVRGEDLSGDERVMPGVLELPLVTQEWEPAYPLAEYEPDRAAFPSPPPTRMTDDLVPPADPPRRVDDPDATRALEDLVRTWTAESNGRVSAVAVGGADPAGAVRALGVPSTARAAPVALDTALAHLAWAAASGGAHGRRRGMAAGRFDAWWVLAAVAGLLDEWPVAPDELGLAGQRLQWWRWEAGEPQTGWALQLAVVDAGRGRTWAVSAADSSS